MHCNFLRRTFYRLAAKAAWRRLRGLSGPRLAVSAERAALKAFHRAAERVPAYGRFLGQHSIQHDDIQDIAAFQQLVPLTNKTSVFTDNDIASLCVDGKTEDATCVYTSSGYSGEFSFGLETQADAKRGRANLDLLLEMYLHATSRRTLLINALPMGVQVPASLPMRLDTSVRADAVLAVIRKLKDIYQQVVIAGEQASLDGALALAKSRGAKRALPLQVSVACHTPLMGAAARAHADVLYVTDDNPRSEDPATIRAAILAACTGGTATTPTAIWLKPAGRGPARVPPWPGLAAGAAEPPCGAPTRAAGSRLARSSLT